MFWFSAQMLKMYCDLKKNGAGRSPRVPVPYQQNGIENREQVSQLSRNQVRYVIATVFSSDRDLQK